MLIERTLFGTVVSYQISKIGEHFNGCLGLGNLHVEPFVPAISNDRNVIISVIHFKPSLRSEQGASIHILLIQLDHKVSINWNHVWALSSPVRQATDC